MKYAKHSSEVRHQYKVEQQTSRFELKLYFNWYQPIKPYGSDHDMETLQVDVEKADDLYYVDVSRSMGRYSYMGKHLYDHDDEAVRILVDEVQAASLVQAARKVLESSRYEHPWVNNLLEAL